MEKEKQSKLKNKILKIIPKAAAMSVTFQNPPFSPGRDHKRAENASRWSKTHGGKGFSGPIISMIHAEGTRKSRNGNIDSQEPTSPKISCMGQIKHKKKQMKKANRMAMPKDAKPVASASSTPREEKKHSSTFRKIFSGVKPGRKSDASAAHDKEGIHDSDRVKPPPPLNQMKRFASGRDAFASFDWTAQQVAPEENHRRDYYSDGEELEEEIIIPFSAPILLGGGGGRDAAALPLKPRKEINLWKRRTMEPPRPLQLYRRE
ncbi:hypothetical protein L6164_015224 [Bauhinia variegata]|uniref:Uncharacterized protein n=1 Tax=Bauhinia variegata TaxID=167791 RepID=A0ACB9NJN0_BAUVA|nr:hypothetical protein L6164_015224 [Bauhinia variegata]